MKRSHIGLLAMAALCMLNACEHRRTLRIHENWYRERHNPVKVWPHWAQGFGCNRVVYIDADCQLTDASGAALPDPILAKVGTRICFFNRTDCELILKAPDALFGQNRAIITLAEDESINVTVKDAARGNEWSMEIHCQCLQGEDLTNPTVRVGEEDEDDGG